jgi:glycosyltransferase involved in cell wall biosynthesis
MRIKKKIIFLTYIPSPYRVDFFNELSKFEDLFVVYYEKGVNNLGWKESIKKHTYQSDILFTNGRLNGYIKLFKILFNNRNETFVIGGYAMMPEILSILFLKILRIKFVLNSDGGFITQGYLKTIFKKVLIKSASFWLSSGENTTKTLEYYGAKQNEIYEYFFTSLKKKDVLSNLLTIKEKNVLKVKLNLNIEKTYIIYVGQLIQRKGVDVLINSMVNLELNNIELLLIGDGESRDHLYELVEKNNLSSKIHFLGKKTKQDVLNYLKASDIFALPSREDIWGLVVNEAVANGLAIVSTKQVGASYSLVKENGFIIDCDNFEELSFAINEIYNNNLIKMQSTSLQIAEKYTIENMVDAHVQLFKKIE